MVKLAIFAISFLTAAQLGAQALGDLAAAQESKSPKATQSENVKLPTKQNDSTPKLNPKQIEQKAIEGDAPSMLALGTFYATGTNGFEKNQAKALEFVAKAADLNLAPAQIYLGYLYGEGKIVPRDFDKAVKYREMGAETGGANDKWSLGNAYLYGFMLPKNQIRAVFWITKAAELNHIGAMLKLVEIYKNLKDAQQLAFWRDKLANIEIDAAKNGNVASMLSIAKKFMKGKDGFPRNRMQGIFWYRQAAEKGNREAMEVLAKMYASGTFLEKNPNKARELFEKIASIDPSFALEIAIYYADGKELPQDKLRATFWFEKAIKDKSTTNTNKLQLAFRYWTALGVEQNINRAMELCREVEACASNNKFSAEKRIAQSMLIDIQSQAQPPSNIAQYLKRK